MIGKLLLRRRGNMVRPLVTETGALVQCNPVPDSVLGIKSYFSPVETPPAEGEKSPTNPSTISGWESVEVTRCGKNILDFATERTSDNEFISVPDSGAFLEKLFKKGVRDCVWSADVKTSLDYTGKMYSLGKYEVVPHRSDIDATTAYKRFTLQGILDYLSTAATSYNGLNFYFTYGSGAIPTTKDYQFEIGTTPTPYTPYQGNTYTATFPSEIGGGYVDWERGVLVETHRKMAFDGTEDWEAIDTHYLLGVAPSYINWWDGVTNVSHTGWWSEKEYNFKIQSNGCFESRGCGSLLLLNGQNAFTTVSDFKTFLSNENTAGTPVTVVYKLKTPVETPLSDLPAIYAIDGINTIYSNAGDVEVTYKGAR